MPLLKNLIDSTLHLFYPHVCTGCGSDILQQENQLCMRCLYNLPETNFADKPNNPIEKKFWGRMQVQAGHSQFYFTKGSLMQHLIHQLKYKSNQDIGFFMGKMLGQTLLESGRFSHLDFLIPLPLFPDKERKRGYNQSTIICNGVSKKMQIPVLDENVVRLRFTETQTRKKSTERWENVEGSFNFNDPALLKNKNILLVDDVVTTGATLEACGSRLLQIEGLKLNIATLAYATN